MTKAKTVAGRKERRLKGDSGPPRPAEPAHRPCRRGGQAGAGREDSVGGTTTQPCRAGDTASHPGHLRTSDRVLGADAARAVLAADARRRRWDRLATNYWMFLRDVGCIDPVDWGITPEGKLPVRDQRASGYGPRRLTRTVLQAMLDSRQAIYARPRPDARACVVCITVNGPEAHGLATRLINDHFLCGYHEPADGAHHGYLIVETDGLLRREFDSLLRDTEAALRNAIHRTDVRLELKGAFASPGPLLRSRPCLGCRPGGRTSIGLRPRPCTTPATSGPFSPPTAALAWRRRP
jgi:hypothetical protein